MPDCRSGWMLEQQEKVSSEGVCRFLRRVTWPRSPSGFPCPRQDSNPGLQDYHLNHYSTLAFLTSFTGLFSEESKDQLSKNCCGQCVKGKRTHVHAHRHTAEPIKERRRKAQEGESVNGKVSTKIAYDRSKSLSDDI